MQEIKQITTILIFWLIGEIIVHLLKLSVPGSIIGMLFLVISLQMKWIKVDQVEKAANFLIKNMAMFFIPAGVGLMGYFDVVKREWLPISVAMIVSTLLVMAVVALISNQRNHD